MLAIDNYEFDTYNSAGFGNIKPGMGILVDLGDVLELSRTAGVPAVELLRDSHPEVLGRVTAVSDHYATLQIADNVEIKIQKSTVSAVVPKGTIDAA